MRKVETLTLTEWAVAELGKERRRRRARRCSRKITSDQEIYDRTVFSEIDCLWLQG